jgi:hypothetical protein
MAVADRAQAIATALRAAADALEAQPPMLRARYVDTLRLYADEPWRLDAEIANHSLEKNHEQSARPGHPNPDRRPLQRLRTS